MTDITLSPLDERRATPASWQDFFVLLKPRVMTLVVFTAIAGMVAAPGDLHPVLQFAAILCIAVGAGAAGAINMWYDSDIDGLMHRTRERPIPSGRVRREDALAFGVFLTVASVSLMGLAVNWAAAAVLAAASAFYVGIYTAWLKRRTPQNIVIGGAAGAFPPLIGWVAVTGTLDWTPVLLFVVIFLWTPPHFWALALYRQQDYRAAGIPMLPVAAGVRTTKRQIVAYAALLLPVAVLPSVAGSLGWTYGIGAGLLSALFLVFSIKVAREDGERTAHRSARRLFGFSIFYLFALFGLVIVDRVPGEGLL